MKNIGLLISAETLFVVFLFLVTPAVVVHHRLDEFNSAGQHIYPLVSDKSLSFSLKSPHPYLNSLTIELKNPMLKNKDDFLVEIIDGQGKILRSQIFNGSNIGDPGGVLPIKFLPITPLEGIPQEVVISSPNLTPESLFYYANDDGLPVYQTTYRQPDLRSSLLSNLKNQLNLIKARSLGYNLFYFSAIFLLNFYLLKSYVKKP